MTDSHDRARTGSAPATRRRERLAAVRAEVAKAVVGQDAAVSGLLVALLCGGHVLMEGVPGRRQDAAGAQPGRRARRCDTRRVQFTPDLMPGDITGSMVIDGSRGELTFREGPVFTNLLLADEINRTPPKTQSALLEAMEEGQVSVDGVSARAAAAVPGRRDPEPGRVRRHLPAARGPARPVPAQGRAAGAGARRGAGDRAPARRPASTRSDVAGCRGDGGRRRRPTSRPAGARSREVQVSPEVAGYVVDIARATRQSPSLSLGVSPRGATALMRTARAWAWLSGRDFVTPDDVKALAQATLAHRLALRPEAELEGVDVGAVLASRARLGPGPALSPDGASPDASRSCSCWGWWRSCCARALGTVWLWVLVVALLVGRRRGARPGATGRWSVVRRPTGSGTGRSRRAEHARSWPTPGGAGYDAAGPRRLAADGRRDRTTGTGSGSPPATAGS